MTRLWLPSAGVHQEGGEREGREGGERGREGSDRTKGTCRVVHLWI